MAQSRVKIELAADLERARARLAGNFDALRHDLSVGTHLKHSFHQHKAAYIGGATLFGVLLSKLPSRKKKIYLDRKPKSGIKEAEKAGLWLILLEFVFKVMRPLLTTLLTKQVTDFVRARSRR